MANRRRDVAPKIKSSFEKRHLLHWLRVLRRRVLFFMLTVVLVPRSLVFMSTTTHLPAPTMRRLCAPDRDGNRWCVTWRRSNMPTSAFWYFRTQREAASALAKLVQS